MSKFTYARNHYRHIGLWLIFMLLVSLLPTRLSAHGTGKPRLNNVAAGPYQITVWTAPDPVRVGDLHVSVILKSALPEDALSTLNVQVELTPPDPSDLPLLQTAEKQENFLQTYYESYFTLLSTGEWQASVKISDGTEVGTVDFPIEVFEKQRIPVELLLGGVVLLLVLLWAARVMKFTQ